MVTRNSDPLLDRFTDAVRDLVVVLADAAVTGDAARLFTLAEAFAAGILLAGDYSAAGIEAAAARLLDQARTVVPPSLAPELAGRRLALVRADAPGATAPGAAATPDIRTLVNDLFARKDGQP